MGLCHSVMVPHSCLSVEGGASRRAVRFFARLGWGKSPQMWGQQASDFSERAYAAAVQTRPPSPTVRTRDSETPTDSRRGWVSLLVWAAAINASLFAAIGIRHVDREAIAFAILYLAGLALLRFRRG